MAQFWLSVCVDVHCCPHCTSPESGSQPHLPLRHWVLPPHALLHEPQLEVSDVVSTHPPSQSVCPDGHAETHLLWEQR
jgi:hypothetical protein